MKQPINTPDPKVGDKLTDRFEVHTRSRLTNGEWHGCMAKFKTIEECHKWIADYNKPAVICDIISFPAEKNIVVEFRIVKLERTVLALRDITYH